MAQTLRMILSGLAACLVVVVLAWPAAAANTRSFTVWGDQEVRFAAPHGMCFLDESKAREAPLLQAIREDTFETMFAVIAACDSLAEDGVDGLTVLQADEGDRYLYPHEVFESFTALRAHIRAEGAPTFNDRRVFLEHVWNTRRQHGEGDTIASYHLGQTLIVALVLDHVDGSAVVQLWGATPLRDLVISIDVRHPADTADQLDGLTTILEVVIETLRGLNPA